MEMISPDGFVSLSKRARAMGSKPGVDFVDETLVAPWRSNRFVELSCEFDPESSPIHRVAPADAWNVLLLRGASWRRVLCGMRSTDWFNALALGDGRHELRR